MRIATDLPAAWLRAVGRWLLPRLGGAWDLAVRTLRAFGRDHGADSAASIAFYGLFSVFPLLLGLVALAGYFLDSADIQRRIDQVVSQTLPDSVALVRENLETVIELRGTFGLVGMVALFWAASAIFGAITRALNRAWGAQHSRPLYLHKLRNLVVAFSVGALFLLSVVATTFSQLVRGLGASFLQRLGISVVLPADLGARLAAFATTFLMFLLIYKLVPTATTYWRQVWPGALLAALLFELGKGGFALYLARFGRYRAVYGSLSSVIVLLIWFFFSALVLVLGAEFATVRWRRRQTSDDAAAD